MSRPIILCVAGGWIALATIGAAPGLAQDENAAPASETTDREATLLVYTDDLAMTIDCDRCGWSAVEPADTRRGGGLAAGHYELVFHSIDFERTEVVDLEAGRTYALVVDPFENTISTYVSGEPCIENEQDASPPATDARENQARAERDAPSDTKPEIVAFSAASYPRNLREWSVEGTVLVKVLVAPSGRVSKACVTESDHPLLDPLALRAAVGCTFKPGLQNGDPVPVWVVLPYEFSRDRHP